MRADEFHNACPQGAARLVEILEVYMAALPAPKADELAGAVLDIVILDTTPPTLKVGFLIGDEWAPLINLDARRIGVHVVAGEAIYVEG